MIQSHKSGRRVRRHASRKAPSIAGCLTRRTACPRYGRCGRFVSIVHIDPWLIAGIACRVGRCFSREAGSHTLQSISLANGTIEKRGTGISQITENPSQNTLQGVFAVRKGLEPSTSGVTGRHSNQLNYRTSFALRWLLICEIATSARKIFSFPCSRQGSNPFFLNNYKLLAIFVSSL